VIKNRLKNRDKDGNRNTVEIPTKSRLFSPITWRILAVNMLALIFLGAGILYLDEYKKNLINAELSALTTQAEMFAIALSETPPSNLGSGQHLVSDISNQIVRRLVKPTGTRARLFSSSGQLISDSRNIMGTAGNITIRELPPPEGSRGLLERGLDMFDRIVSGLFGAPDLPTYNERAHQNARDYQEVMAALHGKYVTVIRTLERERLLLGVAVPVQRYKQVLGALLLTKDSSSIDSAVLETRLDILKVFSLALAVTVLLSIYLAGTIARPLRQLAAAAEKVRRDHSRHHTIPNMTQRNDEIGELAVTLKDMTEALWLRMDAIERFAADVAHEIKNPLTSLRSAVETTARLKDPDQQRKLMTIIEDDVTRLDRLISDISDASRLDAELSRAEPTVIDLSAMLVTLANIHNSTQGTKNKVNIADGTLDYPYPTYVEGVESRISQVFRNLISNAISFSPAEGVINITMTAENGFAHITIDDQGPGIPSGKEIAIFERFYTQRRGDEKFGTHSGLGLSISKQITEAHGGTIQADNRKDNNGKMLGARFIFKLPLVDIPK